MNVAVKASRDVAVLTPDVERPTEGEIVVERVNQNYRILPYFTIFNFNLDPK